MRLKTKMKTEKSCPTGRGSPKSEVKNRGGRVTNPPGAGPGERRRRRGAPQNEWRELLREIAALAGGAPDAATAEALRLRFDRGELAPALIRALRWLDPDTELSPMQVRLMAEDPARLSRAVTGMALERVFELCAAPMIAAQMPAKHLMEFEGAADWARRQPDPVAALACDVEDEPAFEGVPAWPRLAYLRRHFRAGALAPHREDIEALRDLAKIELAHRPAGVPDEIYDLLGMPARDPATERYIARAADEGRSLLAGITGDLAHLMILSPPGGQRVPAVVGDTGAGAPRSTREVGWPVQPGA